jgi:hypothetical protein
MIYERRQHSAPSAPVPYFVIRCLDKGNEVKAPGDVIMHQFDCVISETGGGTVKLVSQLSVCFISNITISLHGIS